VEEIAAQPNAKKRESKMKTGCDCASPLANSPSGFYL